MVYFRYNDNAIRNQKHFKPITNGVLLNPPTTDPPTTDQPTTDHLLTDPPTNRPPTHRPTDPIITDPTDKILFQRLDQWRIFILQNANSWEDVKLYFGLFIWWIDIFIKSLFIFRKSLYLVFFKRKLLFCKRHPKDLCLLFYILNLTALLLPRYSQFISTDGNFSKTRCFSTY